MSTLECRFFGRKIKNPVILASGILGMTRASLETACEHGCGGVIAKSLTLEPRKGHEGPNIVETEAGILNAMGYPNPGIDAGLKEFSGWPREEALIISIVGKDAKEFGVLAQMVEEARSARRESGGAENGKLEASAIEAVISCPHTPGYGTMAGQGTPESVSDITNAIREKTKMPLIIKLSPSVPGEGKAAAAAAEAGASAINMGNSLGPGMKIDIARKKPVLGFGVGGLTGPAIKPVIVRSVYDIYKAVDIPIIGTGGITTGADAIEMMMAGASWASVGSAVYWRGPAAFSEIAKEMKKWMEENGYEKVHELVGVAHEKVRDHKPDIY